MNESLAREVVKFIREQTDLTDISDILVDEFEIGFDEAALLLMLAKTNFA